MEYNFREIEKKWQDFWRENQTFKAENISDKPKFYVLDMFPYPSGAGLHVGHPLGYIASDIYARYKRLSGFNVLHPMGYDAYGLPAEQYAIQTGQHPAITTEKNIARYREQLDKIGFSFDWSREVRTCDPSYYKWTQWTFIQLFEHWYNRKTDKAEPIADLVKLFSTNGSAGIIAACSVVEPFTAVQWNTMTEKEQQDILMNYRLAYLSEAMVNWCPALGTVLANDEVAGGLSVRGGHPVERKSMKQWSLRITAYAQRLLDGLNTIEWTDSLKEIQRNWIGRSQGAEVDFFLESGENLRVFTTRPDTIFGVTFMVLCPEHEVILQITTSEHKEEVEAYLNWTKNRSERERQAEVNKVTGVFTGAYAINPLTEEKIPVWVSEYVLAGYGTGAIMAVPGHDSRDFAFARHFNLPVIQVVLPEGEEATDPATWTESKDSKEGFSINSGFITGLPVKESIAKVIDWIERKKLGVRMINFRLRDAIFSRQRYWGEPFPIYYKEGIPYPVPVEMLPVELPEVDKYLPTESGEPPLARAKNWTTSEGYPLETNTMPGFAGSSAYYLRYMDPRNNQEYFSKEANAYWQNVDLYMGGAEHATGHLIYARFWNKFLFDLGLCVKDEPFQKLINQGMIQGVSEFIYSMWSTRPRHTEEEWENVLNNIEYYNRFISYDIIHRTMEELPASPYPLSRNVDISLTNNSQLDIDGFIKWMPEFKNYIFECEGGYWQNGVFTRTREGSDKFYTSPLVEKMSKSKYNVVTPDDLVVKYGADTLRLYEMFLGPLEQSKPWDTKGIEGVFRFMRKFWRLYHDDQNQFAVSNENATPEELKVLHKTIKKIQEDTERFSFNTAVSSFMICVNELGDLKCNKREILEPLCILIASYAPHIAEELWSLLGHEGGISNVKFPKLEEKYLVENSFKYPVSFNGKMRFQLELPADMALSDIEQAAINAPDSQKWLEGKQPKKIIVVPKKIINIVV